MVGQVTTVGELSRFALEGPRLQLMAWRAALRRSRDPARVVGRERNL